jgi:hypothetical protein
VGSVARRPLGAGGAPPEGPMSLHVNRGEKERAMMQALGACAACWWGGVALGVWLCGTARLPCSGGRAVCRAP